ncbi:MAG: GNAT family N-acetyltransferase [Anaerolineaceae bacterium]|nr:GNAT family N-acetyltransferase [Anaerolineaceae bacterium]
MSTSESVIISPLTSDNAAIVKLIAESQWGDNLIIVHNTTYHLDQLPGYKAMHGKTWLGLLTYDISDQICEIVSLDSFIPWMGVGSKLVDTVIEKAKQSNCKKVVLITTNDNLNAMGFYQKIGFQMVWVEPDAVTRSREIKPSIPLTAENGLPIRDEITFEMNL